MCLLHQSQCTLHAFQLRQPVLNMVETVLYLLDFCNWFQNQSAENSEFINKVLKVGELFYTVSKINKFVSIRSYKLNNAFDIILKIHLKL